jgi:hypothetical protein
MKKKKTQYFHQFTRLGGTDSKLTIYGNGKYIQETIWNFILFVKYNLELNNGKETLIWCLWVCNKLKNYI